ncbi:MAG: thioredoxin family protein [Candidatus Coproplasma sp.]
MKKWLVKHQFILIITGITLLVVGGIALFGWIISSNSNTIEGKRYTPTGEYALLDLGSTNCEPCKKLQPVLAELREEYGDKIDIVFFDITGTSEGSEMANGYKVSVMPTLIFVNKSGTEVKRIVGFKTKEQIESVFNELGWIE